MFCPETIKIKNYNGQQKLLRALKALTWKLVEEAVLENKLVIIDTREGTTNLEIVKVDIDKSEVTLEIK